MTKLRLKNDGSETLENLYDIIDEVNKMFFEIPFGNSNFQNKYFVAISGLTPCRMFRAIGLQLQSRINALKSSYYSVKKENIKIKKLQRKLENCDDDLEREYLQIKIEEILSNRPYTWKLINDCVVEINFLLKLAKNLESRHNFSREAFEKEEEKYFLSKFEREIQGETGIQESLTNMGYVALNQSGQRYISKDVFNRNSTPQVCYARKELEKIEPYEISTNLLSGPKLKDLLESVKGELEKEQKLDDKSSKVLGSLEECERSLDEEETSD